MQRNRGKQQNGKDQRSLQENQNWGQEEKGRAEEKMRDTKGTFNAKMGTIKDRSGMDLAEAEEIKKKWQKYIEELYQKKSL